MNACASAAVRTEPIVLMLFSVLLKLMAIAGIIICLKPMAGRYLKTEVLSKEKTRTIGMDPCSPTLGDLERIVTFAVPISRLENPLLYFCQQGNQRIPGKCNTMLYDDK